MKFRNFVFNLFVVASCFVALSSSHLNSVVSAMNKEGSLSCSFEEKTKPVSLKELSDSVDVKKVLVLNDEDLERAEIFVKTIGHIMERLAYLKAYFDKFNLKIKKVIEYNFKKEYKPGDSLKEYEQRLLELLELGKNKKVNEKKVTLEDLNFMCLENVKLTLNFIFSDVYKILDNFYDVLGLISGASLESKIRLKPHFKFLVNKLEKEIINIRENLPVDAGFFYDEKMLTKNGVSANQCPNFDSVIDGVDHFLGSIGEYEALIDRIEYKEFVEDEEKKHLVR